MSLQFVSHLEYLAGMLKRTVQAAKSMSQRILLFGVLLAAATSSAQSNAEDKEIRRFPRLPGAILLLQHTYGSLYLATLNETRKIEERDKIGAFLSPTISLNGNIVAASRAMSSEPVSRGPSPKRVGTYSTAESKWKDHDIEVMGGTVSISRNGNILACVSRKTATTPSMLRILDLETEAIEEGPSVREVGVGISWAPDGRQIVFEDLLNITVFDIKKKTKTASAKGLAPSWSPSGKWIAFVGNVGPTNRFDVRLIRPDGTGEHVLFKFTSYVVPRLQPVWSPDSTTLLMNISSDPDANTFDIHKIDVEAMKSWKLSRNRPIVVQGWAASE
jgi:hypothetical protein